MTSLLPSKLMYKDAMEQVHQYNSKLLLDRRLRMPYIDSQTGLAQQDCHLWVSRVQRCSPAKEGQIYSYPSRRWRVKKRPDFIGSSRPAEKARDEEGRRSIHIFCLYFKRRFFNLVPCICDETCCVTCDESIVDRR